VGVVFDSLKSMWTRGRLKTNEAIAGGIADAVTDLRTQGVMMRTESWPGTAVDTLPEWHNTLGVAYDPTARSIAEQQTMLEAMETAVGGMTLAKLQAQLDKEFDGRVVVSEAYIVGSTGLARCGLSVATLYALGYDVTGTVYSLTEAARVQAILQRYAPAHLEPNSLLTDLSATAVAIVGLARVGIARTGRAS